MNDYGRGLLNAPEIWSDNGFVGAWELPQWHNRIYFSEHGRVGSFFIWCIWLMMCDFTWFYHVWPTTTRHTKWVQQFLKIRACGAQQLNIHGAFRGLWLRQFSSSWQRAMCGAIDSQKKAWGYNNNWYSNIDYIFFHWILETGSGGRAPLPLCPVNLWKESWCTYSCTSCENWNADIHWIFTTSVQNLLFTNSRISYISVHLISQTRSFNQVSRIQSPPAEFVKYQELSCFCCWNPGYGHSRHDGSTGPMDFRTFCRPQRWPSCKLWGGSRSRVWPFMKGLEQ